MRRTQQQVAEATTLHRDEDLEGSSRGRAVPLAVVSVYAKEQRAHARDASIRMDTRT